MVFKIPLEEAATESTNPDKPVFYEYEILESLEILYSREWAVNFVPVSG
jgi:hypothetical protein